MFKLDLEKAEEPEIKIANICWIIEKPWEFQKDIYFCFIGFMPKPLTVWITHTVYNLPQTVENSERDGNTRLPYLPPEKCLCRSRSNSWNWIWNNRLVPNRKRSMSGCILSPCLLTYIQSTSCEMLGWMKHKLESRLLGEISITSDIQMIPLLGQKTKNKRASWWKWKRRVKKLA